MKNVKMSLANIRGKLSRNELKNIMAGSGGPTVPPPCAGRDCSTCMMLDTGGGTPCTSSWGTIWGVAHYCPIEHYFCSKPVA